MLSTSPNVTPSPALVDDLRRMNPWWSGAPQRPLPATRRHLVSAIHRRLTHRLAPIVVIRGPRQVGKTTALRQVVQDLLDHGTKPTHILAVQFDELDVSEHSEPILRLVDWYEASVLGKTLNQAAHDQEPTYLVFDEVQNLPRWAPQLKLLVDHAATSVLVSGSSALRIEAGRDSLAGRITTLDAGTMSLTEITGFHGLGLGTPYLEDNGLEVLRSPGFWRDLVKHGQTEHGPRDAAFRLFAQRGGYPLAHRAKSIAWPLIADQLNENVIRRVIRIDLQRVDDDNPLLLEEIFRLACRYAGQSPGISLFTREIHRALDADVDGDRVRNALRLLVDSLLIRAIPPLELRLKKTHGHPKLCLADHALRASWLQELVPIDPADLLRQPEHTVLAGHLAESIVGAALATIPGLDIAHLPARGGEPEVDFVVTLGEQRIPIEVKYQRRIDPMRDTEGLRTFLEKTINRAPFGLLITQTDIADIPDPRIVALPLASLLLLR